MKFFKNNSLYLAWGTALIAMLGSLYFSNVRNFPPCVLCWYQRICMYPLVIILGVGILKKDKNLPFYVLPFSLIGLGISIYHNLLYYKILPESLSPCVAGVSCTTKFIEYFHFVTIPFLSFVAFLVINLMMYVYLKSKNDPIEN
ncbi:MAG: disulfide oxidoreductase [Candidatus Doudnabacteria bacterium]